MFRKFVATLCANYTSAGGTGSTCKRQRAPHIHPLGGAESYAFTKYNGR